MNGLEHIKNEIERLYKTNPCIHISVKLMRPKVIVEGTPAKITGVYRNIFQIEENDSGIPTRHTLRYSDVLIGQVEIAELDFVRPTGDLKGK